MNKEVRDFIRELQDRGWIVLRQGKHVKMQYTNGAVTIVPLTPSDSRWLKNKKAEIKRAETNAPHAHKDGVKPDGF